MSAAAILLIAVLVWLMIDRRRMTDELSELHAQSSVLSKRIEALQQSRDIEQTQPADTAGQLEDRQCQANKPRRRERGTTATERVRRLPEVKNNREKFETMKAGPGEPFIKTSDASLGNNSQPHSIEVSARGFKTASASGLTALVDTPTVRDVQLEVGAISETVDVSSAAEAINTNDATLGNSFERKHLTVLPLNARNVEGVLSLQPGVSPTGVNGRRADQSNVTLDGVDTTVHIPSSLSWIRFHIALKTSAIHENYSVTIKTADGRPVTSVDWIEPLTPNQTIIDTPAISTGDLRSGDYVLLLMGKERDGSFVTVAQYSFEVIKY